MEQPKLSSEERKARRREQRKAWYAANKAKHAANTRRGKLRKQYGITPEQYDDMLQAQGHRCAICRTDAPGGRGFWHVDHCHGTGRVRGILCHGCNTGLGNFRDNPVSLAYAIEYLKR
jgi:hypothetical protein